MPLPLPRLDGRTWSELVAEGGAMIPRSAPGWTDHNVQDPGITLLELFAWLTEMMTFRADRVTPPMTRAFLRLAGVSQRPAGVASCVVAVRQAAPAAGPVVLAPGTRVAGAAGVAFEAPGGLTVSPAWLELSPSEETGRGWLWSQAGGRTTDLTARNGGAAGAFPPLGANPRPGDSLLLGFEQLPAGPGVPLSLHVWTAGWETD